MLAASVTGLLGLAAVVPARADYPSTVSSFNPILYYRLNETTPVPVNAAINSGMLGSVANGVYVGAAMHPVEGAITNADGITTDQAASVPGSGHVIIPWLAGMNQPGPFAVECWANTAGSGTETLVLSMIQGQNAANANDRSGWALRENGTDVQFVIGTTTGAPFYYYFSAVGAVTPSAWQHLVAVYDGANFSVYVNGVQATLTVTRQDNGAVLTPPQIAAVTVLTNFAAPTLIGERGYGGWNLNGSIGEVAIYTNALSAGQVLTHYQTGTNIARSTPYSQVVLADNPVAFYRLNEPTFAPVLPTASDSGTLGTSGDGTYQLGTATMAVGPPYAGLGAGNYGCTFSGTAGYIDCGQPGGLATYNGAISVMTWIKVSGWNKSWQAMVTKGDSSWRLHRNSSGSDTRFVGWGTTGLSVQDQAGTRVVDDGFWHHVTAVYDGSAKYIYVDGTLDVSNKVTGTLAVNTYNVFIGENAQSTGRQFAGGMDEVAIFTNGLTGAQVQQIYNAAQVPPAITQQPLAPTGNIYEGMTVSFSAAALGGLPLHYQWTKNGTNLTGSTTSAYLKVNVATNDSGNYALVVTNSFGAVTSSIVALNVQAGPPLIFQPPQSITRLAGSTATFSATIGGSVPRTYQWSHGGTAIVGATNTTLTIFGLQLTDAGSYNLQAVNAYGTTNSTATLTVVTATKVAGAVVDHEPLGYWRMDETNGTTAIDSWGVLNGTLNSGVTNNTAGPVPPAFLGFDASNKAYRFSGSGGHVTLPAFGKINAAMTIIAWINPNGNQNDYTGLVFTRGTGSDTSGLDITQLQNIGYHWNDNANTYNWRSGLVPTTNQWNFVALVVEPTQATAYLDNFTGSGLQSAVNSVSHPASTWAAVEIGSDSAGGRDFNGSMDEVAVYTKALSLDEITAIHDAGASNAYAPSAPFFVQTPQSALRYAGGTALFSDQVGGSVPRTYQWKHAGTNIPGATLTSLLVTNVSAANTGSYELDVTNAIGSTNALVSLTLLTPPPGTYPIQAVAVVPAAYWRLNETTGTTAFDYAVGYDGTIMGNMTLGITGPQPPLFPGFDAGNTCFQFDDASAYVEAPLTLDVNPSAFTISVWINVIAFDKTWQAIVTKGDSSWRLHRSGTSSTVAFSTTGLSNVDLSSARSVNDGLWHHLAAVYDGTNKYIYIDGTLDASVAVTGTLAQNAYPVRIGENAQATGRYFNGFIDEVGLYNQALSSAQIGNLYAWGRFAPTDPPIITQQPISRDLLVGDPTTVSLAAVGRSPLTYQWALNGETIPAATAASYAIPSATYANAGAYQAVVANAAGSATSSVATVVVRPTPVFCNLTNDLVLHLKFDGDYTDSSGRGNDAYALGFPTLVAGKFGQAVHLSSTTATTSYNFLTVNDPNGDLLFDVTNSFTVSFWVSYNDRFNDLPIIGNAVNSTYQLGWVFTDEGGQIEYSLVSTANSGAYVADPVAGSPVIGDGAWHNVVGVVDRDLQVSSVYVDGAFAGSWPIAGLGTLITGSSLTLGQDPTGSYGVNGNFTLDDVGIWRHALTQSQAESIYVVGQNQAKSFDTSGPVKIAIQRSVSGVLLIWQAGTLLSADALSGPWAPVSGASAPTYQLTPSAGKKFYRVQM